MDDKLIRLALLALVAITILDGCQKQHELKAAQATVALDSRASGTLDVAQPQGTLGSKPRK